MFESIHSELAHLFKYKIAADKASDNIIITDREGAIIFINEATTKNIGYTLPELTGRNIREVGLWGYSISEDHHRHLWHTITNRKKTFQGEVNGRRKNGAKYIADLSIFPILDEQGDVKFFVGVERDISKEHEIDQTKNDFISLASHQLRTPLTSISLAIDVILRHPDLSEGQRNSLKDIHREIFEMADLIEALLDVSKIQLGTYVADPEPVHVNDVARSTVAQFKAHLEKKQLRLTGSYDPHIPPIMSSPNVIKIVLQNFLSNAIKYTPRGGHIAVNTTMDKDRIIVSVTDTGWGIPRDQQDKIFSKFSRAYNITKRYAGGSGLGLYLAKHLLSSINGEVWFESVENEGSTFFFSVPVDEDNILEDQIPN